MSAIEHNALKKTPLYDLHLSLGAKMVEFAGYAMPVQYPTGVLKEHLHTREKAGLFDVSHMGLAYLTTTEAPLGTDEAHEKIAAAIETLVPGEIKSLKKGGVRYTVLLSEEGGVLDDLMIARLYLDELKGKLSLVVNAATKDQDFALIREKLDGVATLDVMTDRALLAVQGPQAASVVNRLFPGASEQSFMSARPHYWPASDDRAYIVVSRLGYTGEDGFEISVPNSHAQLLAKALLAAPEVEPVGLGARDSLRLEAGLCLYGHDLTPETSPIEGNISFAVGKHRRAEGGFPGAARIQRELAEGPKRLRVGLRPEGRAPAREGTEIQSTDGKIIGAVTSGGFGPSVGAPVAMGYVDVEHSKTGTKVNLIVRGKPLPAVVADMPFAPHKYYRGQERAMTVKYTEDHEWLKSEGDIYVIGVSTHAAEQLGDVVFVELPEVGKTFAKGDEMAVVESVKAASDVYAPISGDVVEVNNAIVDEPAKVNEDPQGAAWFVKIKPSNPAEIDALMDEGAYKDFAGNSQAAARSGATAWRKKECLMRYLPHNDTDRQAMLKAIGVSDIDALFSDVPKDALNAKFDLPDHMGEMEVERALGAMAAKNRAAGAGPCFIGGGAYKHHIPATVDHIIQRSEFLTAYTPYQPEIAQGTLQYLFEFQTQVAALTGMEVANASMYDGSTGCAEAALMARRVTKKNKVLLSGGLHPHYGAVTRTNLELVDATVAQAPIDVDATEDIASQIDDETACVIVQSPDVFGTIRDLSPIAEAAHAKGALLVAVVTEAVSLGALKSPGEMGADIVVGEGQSIGNGLNYGGPYVGLFATRQKYIRNMPGRLCGETTDAEGKRGFVLTLSTREQHIRRDKATSNICTNSGLCTLAFTIHMTLLGEAGLQKLAMLNHETACKTADALGKVNGVEVVNKSFFNEFTLRLSKDASAVVDQLAEEGVLAGVPGARLWPHDKEAHNLLIVAATECVSDEDIKTLSAKLGEALS